MKSYIVALSLVLCLQLPVVKLVTSQVPEYYNKCLACLTADSTYTYCSVDNKCYDNVLLTCSSSLYDFVGNCTTAVDYCTAWGNVKITATTTPTTISMAIPKNTKCSRTFECQIDMC